MDAREADVGLLVGKKIVPVKHLESTVPSKTVKGGMCVHENSMMQLEDGNIIPIKELSKGNKILSYSFNDFKPVFNDSFEIFKRKSDKAYELIFMEPSKSIILTPEHKVFVVGKNGIEEKYSADINTGDMLLSVSDVEIENKDDGKISKELAHFLGYMLGDGTIDGNRIILYDKDIQLINVYKKISDKLLDKETVILRKGNANELRLYKKSFADFVVSNFPKISTPRRAKDIDDSVLKLSNDKLRYFISGLFDAEGYVDKTGIGLRMTNENIVKKIQLMLTRFGIVASVRGPDKFDRYELRITNPLYIRYFKERIGFSSLKKNERLDSVVKKYRSGKCSRVPVSGIFIRKLIESEGLKKEDFKTYGMFLTGKRNLSYPIFKKLLNELKIKFKNRKNIDLLEQVLNSNLVGITVKGKNETKNDGYFYDLHVPGSHTFVVNGIVVHNSQGRYDRIRDDAVNEFLTKAGEISSKVLLDQKELKGVIIGGPGPIKEKFEKEDYLHYQIKKLVIGIKDIGYTGDFGLEELVKKSEDLLKQAAVMKEKELMSRFLTEIKKNGLAVYGLTETLKAMNMNAVDLLMISEDFNWKRLKLKCETGHEATRDLPKTDVKKQICDICGKEMSVVSEDDLGEMISEEAINFGTKVEFI